MRTAGDGIPPAGGVDARFFMIAIKHVLVSTDFSDCSDVALAYGRELARTFGATLHLLHVTEDLVARAALDAYPMVLPEVQHDLENAAWRTLESTLTSDDRTALGATAAVRTAIAPA